MGVPIIVKELRPRKVDLERVRERERRKESSGRCPAKLHIFLPGLYL